MVYTFCPYCGASLEGIGVNVPKSKSSRSIAKIIIPIILVIVILVGGLFAFFKFIKPNIASDTSSNIKEEAIATLIPYRKGDKWGYCDWNKKIVIPIQYDGAGLFSEGLAAVMVNGKWGFINTKGEMVIPPVYDIPSLSLSFRNGLAPVKFNGKFGYIDKRGTQYWED